MPQMRNSSSPWWHGKQFVLPLVQVVWGFEKLEVLVKFYWGNGYDDFRMRPHSYGDGFSLWSMRRNDVVGLCNQFFCFWGGGGGCLSWCSLWRSIRAGWDNFLQFLRSNLWASTWVRSWHTIWFGNSLKESHLDLYACSFDKNTLVRWGGEELEHEIL